MRATIKDIAKASGYSSATVSMALSDKPNRISQPTKDKILQIAKELQYIPNQIARSLVTKKSDTIGLVISDLTNPHISKVFMSIDQLLQSEGYMLMCVTVNNKEVLSVNRLNALLSSGIEGLIFATPALNEDSKEWKLIHERLAQSGLPVVSRDNEGLQCLGISSDVHVDYELGGYLATKHLLELGHTRIGCVTGTIGMKVTIDRLHGYQRALTEYGIQPDDELIFYGDYEMESGSTALPYLLGKKVTAIFAFNDSMAFGVYKSARLFGVRIPQDISVVGFDDVAFDEVLEVPLTSVCISADSIGSNIAREMMDILSGSAEKGRSVSISPYLLVRGSTKQISN